jgi:hypothetical protein
MENLQLAGTGIFILSVICLIIFYRGFYKVLSAAARKKLFASAVLIGGFWFILIGVLANIGFFNHFGLPPRPAIAILPPVIIFSFLIFSGKTDRLLAVTPVNWLIGFQMFRIVVELLLWQAVKEGNLPVQMSFEGYNYDILSGILAIPAILFIKNRYKPGVHLLYNIIGLLLLFNIIIVAVLSMPTPFRYFMNEPSAGVVGSFPFIYLPTMLVVMALCFHLLSFRQWFVLKHKNVVHIPQTAAVS